MMTTENQLQARFFSTEFWREWEIISRYQASIAANYRTMFLGFDLYNKLLQLAPTYLSQVINPWSFSLMHFTREIKGSAALEQKIITEVAGYGSQLGTIIDALEVIDRELKLSERLKDPEAIYRIERLRHLAEDIKKAKDTMT